MKKIKIHADENVNYKIVMGLRRRGVEITTVQELNKSNEDDESLLEFASANDAVFFTHDDDLVRIATEWGLQGKEYQGIIFVHQQKLSIGEIIRRIKLLVETVSVE
ncbi:DUF5615 family PIN-like protein [bacterium]|nr:DUF5615 family PIN-like protein [bacterium]